jgi:transposase, IS5 family
MIYTFHVLEVKCISNGKEYKKYEFGNKSSFFLTKQSGIVVGDMAFEDNIYNRHNLEPRLAHLEIFFGSTS